jgi:hypothetical protein
VQSGARSAGVAVFADVRGLVFPAGPVLVREALRVTGLGRGLSGGLRTDELAAAPSSQLVLLVFVAALGSLLGSAI